VKGDVDNTGLHLAIESDADTVLDEHPFTVVVDMMRDGQIPTVFVKMTIERAVLEPIAQDAGVEIDTPLSGDALDPAGSVADSYAAMMWHNADAIVDGLR